ncbi:MAG: serine/threonine-protein kinase, partial [Bacteroidota bacterium]|nr:serine/threonine-protein kinase [Bacteroidota bacterium]
MDYINKEILNYRITKYIGEGGMAFVYKAEHIRFSNRKAAVKILKPVLTSHANVRKRFEHEAEIMAKLEHPNIVYVIDFVDNEDICAIVMEFLKGETLGDFIKQSKGLSLNIVYDMSLKILKAFDYAHSRSLVHRDVKPSNIFVEEDKNIKIMDFGIAKLLDENLHLTSTGTQMGTPVYMSPEQVRDTKHIDHRSDLYSLGVMLYYMIEGKSPYDAGTESKFDIFTRIVKEPLPDLEKAK